MSAIFIMIGASLLVAVGFLIAFIWSVKNGQYDDDYTPSVRMLFENTVNKDNSPQKEIAAQARNDDYGKQAIRN